MRKTCALGLLLVLLVMLAACGGTPANAPSTPTPAPTEAAAQSATPTDSMSDAGSPTAGADVGAAPVPVGAPLDPEGSGSGSSIAEGHDACSGVAATFEEKVRARFNECYQAGKKTNPELAGTIKVTLKVDVKGKVKYVPEKSKLDPKVVTCMVNAVKKETFDSKACSGKDIAVSKTFGAP